MHDPDKDKTLLKSHAFYYTDVYGNKQVRWAQIKVDPNELLDNLTFKESLESLSVDSADDEINKLIKFYNDNYPDDPFELLPKLQQIQNDKQRLLNEKKILANKSSKITNNEFIGPFHKIHKSISGFGKIELPDMNDKQKALNGTIKGYLQNGNKFKEIWENMYDDVVDRNKIPDTDSINLFTMLPILFNPKTIKKICSDHTQSDPIMNSLNELTAHVYGNNNPNITDNITTKLLNLFLQTFLQEIFNNVIMFMVS